MPVVPPVAGRAPQLHVVQLLGGGSAGTGAHVRSLAAGLDARGVRVTVCASQYAERRYDFAGTGARFIPLPVRAQADAVRTLRAICCDADLVHAHGMRAGLVAALALRRRAVPLVVTWHARPGDQGVRERLRRLTERWVARAASVVLGATSDLVDRARRRGARDARLAPVALPAQRTGRSPEGEPHKVRAELGVVDRPLLIAEQGHDLLLAAARGWRGLDPQPLLVMAGEGPQRGAWQRRIEREDLPVRLLERAQDVRRLLPVADVALAAPRWEARPQLAQEALRGGVPLVATAVGGVPELVGDAAVLIPYGNPGALASAVRTLLEDPDHRAALTLAGRARARSWPTEDTTVAQVLSVYDELSGAR
ncbi:glycosyltransferase family 4 protein [Streptomyces xiamenensis]|uniref:glycosyltransferase family 4 protein n=1 Tax=Streptomyces xiamenensis TaxID=408015 RepID=UPI00369DFECF